MGMSVETAPDANGPKNIPATIVTWEVWGIPQSFGNPCNNIYIYTVCVYYIIYIIYALILIMINPYWFGDEHIFFVEKRPVFWPWHTWSKDILLQGDLDMEAGRISFSNWLEMDDRSPLTQLVAADFFLAVLGVWHVVVATTDQSTYCMTAGRIHKNCGSSHNIGRIHLLLQYPLFVVAV